MECWLREQVAVRTDKTVSFHFPIVFIRSGKSVAIEDQTLDPRNTKVDALIIPNRVSRREQFLKFLGEHPDKRRADVAREFSVSRAFISKVLNSHHESDEEVCLKV